MTKEQEKAIRYVIFMSKTINFDKSGFPYGKESLETVLNMLKEKDAEIEKYKKLLADNLAKNLNDSIKAKEKADTDLDDLDKGWKVELEKKDKMIDLMAYSLADYVMYYEYDKCRSPLMIKDKSEELKEYYERKATNDG